MNCRSDSRRSLALLALCLTAACSDDGTPGEPAACRLAQVRSGVYVTHALDEDGRVWTWADGKTHHAAWLEHAAGVVQLEAATHVGCVVARDGSGLCAGGETVADVTAVATTRMTSIEAGQFAPKGKFCFMQRSGRLLCGGQFEGLRADGGGAEDIDAVSMSDTGGCMRKRDGSFSCWGRAVPRVGAAAAQTLDPFEWRRVPDADGATQFEVGRTGDLVCLVKADGVVWCWGRAYGWGTGDDPAWASLPDRPTRLVPLGRDIVKVGIGSTMMAVLKRDGSLWYIGNFPNTAGMNPTPTPVPGVPARVTDVSVGDWHLCALLEDRTAWCWGHSLGQFGPATYGKADSALLRGCR